MTIPSLFNRSVDAILCVPAAFYKLAGFLCILWLGGCWLHSHDQAIRQAERTDAAIVAAKTRESAAVETLKVVTLQVVHDSVRVVRTLHSVDSLWRAVPETLTTHADTVAALNELPVLRLATDSAIHACSETQSLFYRYRTACDSQAGALRDQRDDWHRKYDSEHPGKLAGVLKWVEIGGAAFIGFKLGRAR